MAITISLRIISNNETAIVKLIWPSPNCDWHCHSFNLFISSFSQPVHFLHSFHVGNVLYREPFFSFSFAYGIWTMTWQLLEFLPFFTIFLSTTCLRFGPSLPLDPWILTWTLSFFWYTTFLWNVVCFFTIRSSILFLLSFTLSRGFLLSFLFPANFWLMVT